MCRLAAPANRATARASKASPPSNSTRRRRPSTPGAEGIYVQQDHDQRAVYPSLKGRRVLITGGGSGIGEGLVEGFARQGSDVLFFDIEVAASKALADRTGAAFRQVDLT